MVFGIFKSRPDLGIDLKKHSSKKFNKYVEKISKSFKSDDIKDYGSRKLLDVDEYIQDNFRNISYVWWKDASIILGNELKKKTVGEMYKTVHIFFSTSLDKKLYNKNNVDNTYIALICNIAVSYNNNNKGSKSIKKILGLR